MIMMVAPPRKIRTQTRMAFELPETITQSGTYSNFIYAELSDRAAARRFVAQCIAATHGKVEGHSFENGYAALFMHSSKPEMFEEVEKAFDKIGGKYLSSKMRYE